MGASGEAGVVAVTAKAAPPALRLDCVAKSFRRETGETVLALDNISFSVGKGGLAALVGPDGAGKTTLLRLLAGLMKADAGTVSVLGIDAAKDPQAIQSRISYMPQQFGLYDDLTVQENLDLYADLHGVTADEKRTQYPRLMEMTGLDPFQDAARRAAFRRDETKARPGLHARPVPRIAAAGRADRRGRSALPPRTVGDHPSS